MSTRRNIMELNIKCKKKWLEKYSLLQDYYKEHGNIDVPRSYTVGEIKLGNWLYNQIRAYKGNNGRKITEDQIQLLNDLGMRWNLREEKWDENYYLLEEYYKEHGNIDVPTSYQVDGVNLGFWVSNQRQAYKGNITNNLTTDQIQLLNDLGMKWDVREEKWDENYYLLEEYYKEHGNIDVPTSYQVDGVNLGTWLNTQRQAYGGKGAVVITEDQIQLLNDLDIDWSIKDTKLLNSTITEKNVEKYNQVLEERLNHILDDLIYEGMNEFSDYESQQKIEKTIVKRLWR